ncbi:ectonucleotide pyrophosphatase/phosphodiesterase [Ectobacillus ponti]|uniref:Ectonucleotide pyrophosphatase/phosphodiesterase n=1 Tax=Ectobacillus ponti TaxID=2961894 RepID=A0AA42BNW9_9BACI|nr:ectonucleotide pyrophosphatase/phosphodiesterase [Ectobacillus ponti]MCP8968157.1 ectonucleotide pyrophosphatase/phosphodiesterase [Ectobacillus ponti]
MKRLTDHLIVISFDCLSALDLPVIKQLPHFQALLQRGALAQQVQTIYPSITYPCHATIVTGRLPNRHGITSNTLLQPGRSSPDWHWHRRDVQGTTLYDEARKAGLTTAALLWPVTAKADIDYNMPEIFANRPWHNQILVSLLNGSPLYQWELNRLFGHLRNGLSQPELDDFVLASTVHTIQTKKPNLLLVHFTDLDTQRHLHGFSSEEAMAALRRHDERLGAITNALQQSGLYDHSTLVALGDHSALDEAIAIKVNVLLRKHGLLSVNTKGKLRHWDAYCQSCDGSAYIHVKKKDTATLQTLQKLLESLLQDPESGIEQMLTGAEAEKRGADGTCAFLLEAKQGYYFLEDYEGAYLRENTAGDMDRKKYTRATHGYSPEKPDYSTIVMAAGRGIQPGTIPFIRLIDEGPTFARLLGLDLGDTDGRAVEELLQQ